MNISIIGADKESAEQDREHSALFDIPLLLSESPDTLWVECFEECKRQQFTSMMRRSHVRGDKLFVKCPLDELQRQVDYLKGRVACANDCHAEKLIEAKQAETNEQNRRDAIDKEVSDAIDDLKF